MTDAPSATRAEPPLGQALAPVVLLVALLGAAVYLFGDESSFGPNQIALVLGTAAAGLVGLANGQRWAEIEEAIRRGIGTSMGAVLILLVVGSVIGTWILAGIVPTMIYYGLSLLAPSVFYAAACAICAVVALATGSSWTTAGTVGLALIGTAAAYGLPPGPAAGAIVSGAYFGDTLSPLSDTTNPPPAGAAQPPRPAPHPAPRPPSPPPGRETRSQTDRPARARGGEKSPRPSAAKAPPGTPPGPAGGSPGRPPVPPGSPDPASAPLPASSAIPT